MQVRAKWNFCFGGHSYQGGEVFEVEEPVYLQIKGDVDVIIVNPVQKFEEKVFQRTTKVVRKVQKKSIRKKK